MRIRALPLLLLAWLLAILAGCATVPRTIEIPQERLQAALERSFQGEGRTGGMRPLHLAVPTLQLLPERNRIRLDFSFGVPARMLPRAVRGALGLSFAIRYSPSDSTLRADDVRVERVEMQGLTAEANRFLEMTGAMLAERMLEDKVLHTLDAQDIARAGGRIPGDIRVTSTGIRIELVPQAAPALR